MGLTHNPNGITSFGIPILGSGNGIPTTTGSVFFVDSGAGNAGNDGTAPDNALVTIDAAVNKCTASKGDVIIVMPGHAGDIASATSLVLDVAGVSIIGLGQGRNRPVLTFTATGSRIPISADNVLVSNIVLMASIAAIVSGVTVTGDDVVLDQVEFDLDATGVEFLQVLDIDAASRVTVQNCRLIVENIAGCNTGIRFDTTPYLRIVGCEFRGDFTTAAISGTAGSAAASTDVMIANNMIENLDTTAGLLIDAHDNGTGIISGTRGFTYLDSDPALAFDPGDMFCADNLIVNDENETAIQIPELEST